MTEFRKLLINGKDVLVDMQEDGTFLYHGQRLYAEDCVHLPPVSPQMMVCVHLNYRSRLEELDRKQPPAPTYFLKATSSLNSHKGKIVRPKNCQYLNYEGEIVLVVGKKARNVEPSNAGDYVLGYTIGNDFGIHDFRDTDDNSMVRVKGTDTLGPLGPGVITNWDFSDKAIKTYVDDELVQEDNTNNMLWNPHYLLSDLSRTITLNPGDVIFTGTPAMSRPVVPRSEVSVVVEGLGCLKNTIISDNLPVSGNFGAQPSKSNNVLSVALGSDFRAY